MNDHSVPLSKPPGQLPELMLFASTAEQAKLYGEHLARLGYLAERALPGGIAAAIQWTRTHPVPALLLVDLDGEALPLQAINELNQSCDPACQIIALGSRQDVNLYRTLLHHGLFDYLIKPVPLDQLADTLTRAAGSEQEMPARTGRTIAVTGAAGGSGTSTVVSGLARLLSEQRHTHCAVVDFDRGNGDQALLLGYEGEAGLAAVLGSEEIDTRFLQRSMGQINERLFLLAQEAQLHAQPELSIEQLLNLGGNLCHMFNQVLWDLPAGRPQGALEVLANAQTRIILTELNVQDARNTLRLLREIGDESSGQQLLLVANPSRQPQAGIVERRQFEDFVGRPFDLVLPHAGNALSQSLLRGPLRLDSTPGFQVALLELADLACGRQPDKRGTAPLSIINRLKHALGRSRSAA